MRKVRDEQHKTLFGAAGLVFSGANCFRYVTIRAVGPLFTATTAADWEELLRVVQTPPGPVLEGEVVTLQCGPGSGAGPPVSWRRDGEPVAGPTCSQIETFVSEAAEFELGSGLEGSAEMEIGAEWSGVGGEGEGEDWSGQEGCEESGPQLRLGAVGREMAGSYQCSTVDQAGPAHLLSVECRERGDVEHPLQ